jgi:hypothetical protein
VTPSGAPLGLRPTGPNVGVAEGGVKGDDVLGCKVGGALTVETGVTVTFAAGGELANLDGCALDDTSGAPVRETGFVEGATLDISNGALDG